MKVRNWDTEKAFALYKQGPPDGAIAKEVGASRRTVYAWRRRQGFPANCARGRPSYLPEHPLALPSEGTPPVPGKGPIAFSVEYQDRALSIRASDVEGLRQIYEYAGKLLEDIAAATERAREVSSDA